MLDYIVYLSAAALLATGSYYRFQASKSNEPIDRRQEGWPLLIAIRLSGFGLLAALLFGARSSSLSHPLLRQAGAVLFVLSTAWLIWMYRSLGRNLTDTVVTRRDASFVTHGPYRYVRNPMYSGLLAAGVSLGLFQGSWFVPAAAALTFTLLAIRTRTEERFLIARFGSAYQEYMNRVNRFFPG